MIEKRVTGKSKKHYAYCNVMYDIGHDRASASCASGHTWKELGLTPIKTERNKENER